VEKSTFAEPPREAGRQCVARDANEAIERSNITSPLHEARRALRCECGDAACLVSLSWSQR
jgi:hypothetical protein